MSDEFDYNDGDSGDRWKITKPNALSKYIGKLVADEGGFTMADIKKLISVKQIKAYVTEVAKRDEDNALIVNSEDMQNICDMVYSHIVGFDLTKAAARGMLECYWDDEENTMMFKAINGHDIDDAPEDVLRRMEEDDEL